MKSHSSFLEVRPGDVAWLMWEMKMCLQWMKAGPEHLHVRGRSCFLDSRTGAVGHIEYPQPILTLVRLFWLKSSINKVYN